jgi:hypothetical protein
LGQKYLKLTKMKTLQDNIGDESTQKHEYIDANQELTANPWRSPPSLPHLIIGMKIRNYSWHTSTLEMQK